jgi:hypothetical protein
MKESNHEGLEAGQDQILGREMATVEQNGGRMRWASTALR